ncbi:hypothetical protein RJ641_025417 [Dillenia turbinata]|uniref:Uncharacterized protein n=1 Tax=Dillenia turbinata TaxID=194707 RepID=A0AAN8W1K0_9MAGN
MKLITLRMLLHKPSALPSSAAVQRLHGADSEDLRPNRVLVRKVLGESLLKLQGEATKQTRSIRWELGACWVQHLQNQASGKTDSKKTEEAKVEPAVKGLGKQGGLLKEIKKKIEDKNSKGDGKDVSMANNDDNKKSDTFNLKELGKQDEETEKVWKNLLPEAAYLRLKESETGLHLKIKSKPGQNSDLVMDEYQKDETLSPTYPVAENSSDKENKSDVPFVEPVEEKPDVNLAETLASTHKDDLAQGDTSDEGWQEAVPKGRSPTGRKSSSSRRPSLAKLNTNFMNVSQTSRYRGKPTNFTSPRTSPSESSPSPGAVIPVQKKFVKSPNFSPKPNNTTAMAAAIEKQANPKSGPASPASNDQVVKSSPSPISVQAVGKLLSYKEVALAPPGTIVKAVAEQLPKDNASLGENPQVLKETAGTESSQKEEIEAVIVEEQDEAEKQVGDKKDVVSVDVRSLLDEKEEVKSSVDKEDKEAKAGVGERARTGADSLMVESPEEPKSVTQGIEMQTASVEDSEETNSSEQTSKSATPEPIEGVQQEAASINQEPPSVLTASSSHLLEKDACEHMEYAVEGVDGSHDLQNGDACVETVSNGEKQDEAENGKETSKKLSAAAPPFNPSIIPVFGSVPVPGFKEHGGILPPPVNIPPILTMNPVRRSPHQSATARVPYGPRLSGGYNRSSNRVPRNKPGFHSGEHAGDGNHFSPPRIMNPHAAEFVPGQPWVPTGYPVSPNGYLASSNGYPIPPNGFPVSPNGYPAPINGIPVIQNGFPPSPAGSIESPVSSAESPTLVTVDADHRTDAQVVMEEGNKNSLKKVECEIGPTDKKAQENQSSDTPVSDPQSENTTSSNEAAVTDVTITTETGSSLVVSEKSSKRWGDYSDGEADIVEVAS